MDRLILWGGLGGFLIQLLPLAEVHTLPKEQRPDLWDFYYILAWLIYTFLAALAVYLFKESGFNLKAYHALYLGLSAPALFRQVPQSSLFKPSPIQTDPDQ